MEPKVPTKVAGLASGEAIRRQMEAFPRSVLPATIAGRLEFLCTLASGFPLVDDDGNDTGERTEPVITAQQFAEMMEDIDDGT